MERRHGHLTYYLTQFLSGHGCFNKYLWRFKKRREAKCIYCLYPNDDAEHTFFECERWHRQRRALELGVGEEIKPENVVDIMLKNRTMWDIVAKYVMDIICTKEEDERKMDSEARRIV